MMPDSTGLRLAACNRWVVTRDVGAIADAFAAARSNLLGPSTADSVVFGGVQWFGRPLGGP
jgi:hypothetical protein